MSRMIVIIAFTWLIVGVDAVFFAVSVVVNTGVVCCVGGDHGDAIQIGVRCIATQFQGVVLRIM